MTPRTTFNLRAAGMLLLTAAVVGAGAWVLLASRGPGPQTVPDGPAPASIQVRPAAQPGLAAYDGVVQAVRQTVLAAQVAGAVVALEVKAGDAVKAGQLLVRLDARAAEQSAAAGAAQVRAAGAALDAARREYERQQQLLQQKFISQAAFERAEAQFKTAQAEAAAQLATAGAARTQADFYAIRAPYAGVVSEVSVVLGDMAMPGRPLVTLHDPAAMRVSAAVPQSVAASLPKQALPAVDLPATSAGRIVPVHMQLLPAVDAATHTQELRLDLPEGTPVAPGMFARVWLPAADAASARVFVPVQSVVRRAELTAVYVIGDKGQPLLRQVRLGRAEGDRVEVLAGLSAGERVALDPQAAASAR
ncbi:efflux RND transporter periplasmic adaptor subunit [Ramlibacter albus]|uniref:Efflux RND transporter periplasmic adaptor subunit n=1 Tax=Ramlibacter albus TaxID=2079448 RepID=A0A923M6Z8_9BURK|nr:efflux RND transporter periplasmic adaptor subunit [Ramlibacter albus]MBC5763946.1 efflux RND transporter periplasmic adaptor subunit [Ramlibacter albus]